MSSELGSYKKVTTRIWPWHSDDISSFSKCSSSLESGLES